jgi:hypothetical protein
MPLPIVLGGKSVSAQSLPGPCCHRDEADDGTLLEPLELYQTLSWGVCPLNEWLVRVTCSYYDLVIPSTGHRDCTMAEVRIQISPITRPLSPNYRETSHHLKLFDGAQDDYPICQPQVVVSHDRRNLAVLLFHPHQQSSAMIIFQLRKPRSDMQSTSPIPLPSYCAKVGNESNASSVFSRDAPAVATHPRFVSVWGISTICSIPNVTPSILLAACHDGSLVWLDARSSLAVATGILPTTIGDSDSNMLPLASMTAAPTSGMEKGRLLAVGENGRVVYASWQLESSSSTSVQHTFLKRASTGTVVLQSSISPSVQLPKPQENGQIQQPPTTTKRMDPSGDTSSWNQMFSPKRMQAALLSPMLQRATNGGGGGGGGKPMDFSGLSSLPFGNKNNNKKHAQEEAAAVLQKQRMHDFVLQELQEKTESGAWIANHTTVKGGQRHLKAPPRPKHRQRQSDILGSAASSASSSFSSGNHHQNGTNSLQRSMQLEILSTLQEEDDQVVDARFASMATIVCVLYKPKNNTPKDDGDDEQQQRHHHLNLNHHTKRVAQMFSICATGSFQPLFALTLSQEQVETANRVQSSTATNCAPEIATSMQSRWGLDHDFSSDTFAISTSYYFGNTTTTNKEEEKEHEEEEETWVGCLWNWRSNVLGWTIRHETESTLWSRLYFGKHAQQGTHLVFLESTQERYLQTRKQVVATGLLSPSSSFSTMLEPCSLLMSSDAISFPDASQVRWHCMVQFVALYLQSGQLNILHFSFFKQRTASDVLELAWKVSTLPLTYLNTYGPPQIAAVGLLRLPLRMGFVFWTDTTNGNNLVRPMKKRPFRLSP